MNLEKTISCPGTDFFTEGCPETYQFPCDWDVHTFALPNQPTLSDEQISDVLNQRFLYHGQEVTLASLSCGKKRIAILVDDLSRPTPTYQIVPNLLKLLVNNDATEDSIRFYIALGTHRELSQPEMALKLGWDVVKRFNCQNLSAFKGEFENFGFTSGGTPLFFHKIVCESDLVITINCLIKHRFAYATGGSKMILPGIARIDTILHNHNEVTEVQRQEKHRFNQVRADMDEAAKIFSRELITVSIDATVGAQRQLTGLYIGDCAIAFQEHVDRALVTYDLEFNSFQFDPTGKADIGFFRMNAFSSDPLQISRCMDGWEKVCRVPVIISDGTDRIYFDGKIQGYYGDFLSRLEKEELLPNLPIENSLVCEGFRNVILFSPNMDMKSLHNHKPKIYLSNNWQNLLSDLYRLLGPNKKVAFFRDAAIHVIRVKD